MNIKFNNISISIKSGKKIIENLSFILHDGDKLCLIGEEGNGKSTLLKFINNKQDISSYCEFQGSVNCDRNIAYLPQFLDKSWNSCPVLDFLMKKEFGSEIDYSYYEKFLTIEKLFTDFSIKHILDSNQEIGTCSGGEKIKIQMIKLLMREPHLFLLDEPTNDIDLVTLEWLETYLMSIDTPIVFVSHDEEFIAKVANIILHIEHIKRKTELKSTFYRGRYEAYLTDRNNLLRQQAKDHYRTAKIKEEKRQILIHQHTLVENHLNKAVKNPSEGRILAKKMKSILTQEKKLDKMKVIDDVSVEEAINCFFDDDITFPNSKRLIDINDIEIRVADKVLIRDMELKIYGPDHVIITGPNGTGKSTLMKYLLEKIRGVSGIKIGYMPQDYESQLDLNMTSIEHLQAFLGYDKEVLSKIMCFLGAMRFVEAEMVSKIREISGGQRAKLYLMTLIMNKCNVLFLDEPTRNLSPLSNPKIRSMLNDYQGAIIAITHDRKFIQEVGRSIYRIENQKLIKIK